MGFKGVNIVKACFRDVIVFVVCQITFKRSKGPVQAVHPHVVWMMIVDRCLCFSPTIQCMIIGIKHGFSCINIRQFPWEVLKTEAEGRGFQHLPRDLANVNALKNHVRSLLLHKN